MDSNTVEACTAAGSVRALTVGSSAAAGVAVLYAQAPALAHNTHTFRRNLFANGRATRLGSAVRLLSAPIP